MSFERNDIVTKYAMDKAIAEGGGGTGSGITWIPVTTVTPALVWTLDKNFNEIKALIDAGTAIGITLVVNESESPNKQQVIGGEYYGDFENDNYMVGFGWSGGGARFSFYGTSATGTLTCDISF